MNALADYLPLLVPLILIQLTLMGVALWDLSKRSVTRGPKWIWILIIVFVNLIGPILYLVVARDDE